MDAQGTVADRIRDHAENFDLIAISPHEKTKTKTPFGSVTAKVVRSGDKPVLVVP
jgi:nucleotide-binding universal stress UspA family protein